MSLHRAHAVEALYSTVLWPEGWKPALASIQQLFKADHVLIDVGGQPSLAGTIGVDEAQLARLFDPECIALVELIKKDYTPGRVTLRQEIYPDTIYEKSEAYQRFVRPLGGYHGVILCERGTLDVAICRGPTKTAYDEDARNELASLQPHLTAAREIARRLGTARDELQSLAGLIGRVNDAVVLTDADGRIAMINAGAVRLAVGATGFQIAVGDMIAGSTAEATFALRAAIAHAANVGDAEGRWLPLPGPDGQTAQFARILSFSPGRFGLTASGGVAVAVFLKDAIAPIIVDRSAIIDLFGLTLREADVVALVVAGYTPRDIGVHLGVSLSTVRTHLTHVFEKTATKTQAGLVALVSRLQA